MKVPKLNLYVDNSEDKFKVNLYGEASNYFLKRKEVSKLLDQNVVNLLTVVMPSGEERHVIFNRDHLQYSPGIQHKEKAFNHLDLIPVSANSKVTVEVPILYVNRHLIKVGVHKELITSLKLKVAQPLRILSELSRFEVDLFHHLSDSRTITIKDVLSQVKERDLESVMPLDTVVYKLNLSSKERKALHQKWLLQKR